MKAGKQTSVDELISSALAYHSPQRLEELLEFTARLRRYAPYNAMLLHIQDPMATMVATAGDWKARYGRDVRLGARPLVILAPMHPVLFVFDLRETVGPDLPEAVQSELRDVFAADGVIPESVWNKTAKNCALIGLDIVPRDLGPNDGGDLRRSGRGTCELSLNNRHTWTQQYATMVHELAHLFLGHVIELPAGWWNLRPDLKGATQELEAEITTHIVCQRAGIRTASDKYLARFLKCGPLPYFSLDQILIAAGKIEEMGRRRLRLKARESSPPSKNAHIGIKSTQ